MTIALAQLEREFSVMQMIWMIWSVSKWKILCKLKHLDIWLAWRSDFNGVNPLLPHLNCRSVWCRLAGISVRAEQAEVHRVTQMRVSLTWPAQAGQPGCHRVSLGYTHCNCHASGRAFQKNHLLWIVLISYDFALDRYFILYCEFSWFIVKYWNCDIIVKCFLAKIAWTEMTEHLCLYLWWDSSASVSTLLTSCWKSQFTIYIFTIYTI